MGNNSLRGCGAENEPWPSENPTLYHIGWINFVFSMGNVTTADPPLQRPEKCVLTVKCESTTVILQV